jgi:pSer/pThr/pTyr-binding forkhead associated (FHA) protein
MALLELGGKRFTLPQGDILLGADPGSAIPLSVPGVLPRHAKLKSLPDGQVVITKAVPEAEVLINGVRLGAEPTPLLHGDKVEIGGQELTFVDERRSGSTQYVQAMSLPQAMAQAKSEAKGSGGKVTVNTGGRVVSLTDGREYAIAGTSLVFGRDAACDVVVPGKDVSRRHAEIVQTPKGYLIVDSSTNGTMVNDVRIEGQRLLARADVILIGEEKFRFYADTAAPAAPAPPASPPPSASPPPPENPKPGSAASPVSPAQGSPATGRLRETVHGVPAAPRPSTGALASFLVRGGALKGQRLSVKTPVVNIGRADYNDLVFPDESVSTTHAKLQRREGVWVLVDLDSTNGTFVDGDQITGEAPLAPGANVRFGEIATVFEPTDESAGVAKGGATRVMEVMTMSPAPKAAAPARPSPPPAPAKPAAGPPAAPAKPVPAKPVAAKPVPVKPKPAAKPPVAQQKTGKGCGGSAAVLLLGIIGLVYWMFI